MAAGEKRTRQQYTNDVKSVLNWGGDTVKWIWGMRADSPPATTVRARAYIEVKGTIFCNSCGKEFGALHMRDDMLVHIHRNWFNKRLEDAC